MQFRGVVEKITQALAVAVVVIVVGLFIFMVAGCATWTNFVHEQAQEEYRQEIEEFTIKHKVKCIEIGGVWIEGKGCNLDD